VRASNRRQPTPHPPPVHQALVRVLEGCQRQAAAPVLQQAEGAVAHLGVPLRRLKKGGGEREGPGFSCKRGCKTVHCRSRTPPPGPAAPHPAHRVPHAHQLRKQLAGRQVLEELGDRVLHQHLQKLRVGWGGKRGWRWCGCLGGRLAGTRMHSNRRSGWASGAASGGRTASTSIWTLGLGLRNARRSARVTASTATLREGGRGGWGRRLGRLVDE
jgi:hypothetical protein